MIVSIIVTVLGQQCQQLILLQSENVILIPVIGPNHQQQLMCCHFYLLAALYVHMQLHCKMNTNYLLKSMKVIASAHIIDQLCSLYKASVIVPSLAFWRWVVCRYLSIQKAREQANCYYADDHYYDYFS